MISISEAIDLVHEALERRGRYGMSDATKPSLEVATHELLASIEANWTKSNDQWSAEISRLGAKRGTKPHIVITAEKRVAIEAVLTRFMTPTRREVYQYKIIPPVSEQVKK